jgi:hypothetical protein
MRIRSVKPEFWGHEIMASLPPYTQLLALALLNYADDEGYFLASPQSVRGALFPFEDDSTIIQRMLDDLSKIGYVVFGKSSDGRKIGKVVNFLKHQRIDRPQASKIKASAVFDELSTNDHRALAVGMEQGTGNREQGKEAPQPPEGETLPDFQPDFAESTTLIGSPRGSQKKKKGGGVRSSGELDFPDGMSDARRVTLLTWLRYKAEMGKHYKPMGFAALLKKLEPFTDAEVEAAVQQSMSVPWTGLFPKKLTAEAFGGLAFGQRKKEGGAALPPDDPKVLGGNVGPVGWESAWAALYSFARPGLWIDVPPANASEIQHYLRTHS